MELKVESSWKPVQLDLPLGEEPGGSRRGGLPWCQGEGGGEHSLGKVASKITSFQHWQLVRGVKWVDKRKLRDGIIVILIFILLGLSNLILQHRLGSSLASAGDVVSFKDPGIGGMVSHSS